MRAGRRIPDTKRDPAGGGKVQGRGEEPERGCALRGGGCRGEGGGERGCALVSVSVPVYVGDRVGATVRVCVCVGSGGKVWKRMCARRRIPDTREILEEGVMPTGERAHTHTHWRAKGEGEA